MRRLIGTFSLVVVLVGVLAGPASAARQGRTVVARINGGGTAIMVTQAGAAAEGITHWGAGVTLYSDFSASGHIDCVDQVGGNFPGNVFGEVTSWSGNLDGGPITLNVPHGTFVGAGGHPQDTSFRVTIEAFGGAGVGAWTLWVEVNPEDLPGFFVLFCDERVTSGQIVLRREDG